LTLVVGIAFVGLVLGAIAGAVRPVESRAGSCDRHNTVARDNDNIQNHRGDRAHGTNNGIWVPATGTSVSCARVSSLIIALDPNGYNFVEVGWFDASGEDHCSYTGSGPRQLWFAEVSGTAYCATQTPNYISSQNAFHGFSVQNPDLDGDWSFFMDGVKFKELAHLNQTFGVVLSNGERHGGDIANSEFKGLQYQDSGGWHDWVNPGNDSDFDNDSDYHNQFFSDDTHVKVVHD
jgi:hypothetical protein